MFPEVIGEAAGWSLVAVSAVTSFITAAFGIGGGVLLLAIMAVLMPAAALIPVHGVVQIGSNAGRTAIMFRHIERGVLLPFCAGSVVGAVIGGAMAVQLPPHFLKIGLGCFILYSVWGYKASSAGGGSVALVGVLSTFLTMFFGATGTFVAAMVKTLGLGRLAHVATHSACMTAQHAFKVATFGFLGFAFAPYVWLVVLMVVSGFVGTLLGKRVLTRLDDRRFHTVLAWILTALALRLIYEGGELLLA